MKQIIGIVLVLLVAGSVAAEGFRGIPWGSSQEDVIAQEGVPDERNSTHMIYSVEVAGMEAGALLEFEDNGLVTGNYVFTQQHRNEQNYVRDYFRVRDLLNEVYGKPTNTEHRIDYPYSKDDQSEWGQALATEHARLYTGWMSEETGIVLLLANTDQPMLGIQYAPMSAERGVSTDGL